MPATHSLPPDWTAPLVPHPVAGESWSSFLQRLAQLNAVNLDRLCSDIWVPNDDILTPDQMDKAVSLTRLGPGDVLALTLNKWAGGALPGHLRQTTTGQGPPWTWTGRRTQCSHCTVNGDQLLIWRLPWITACTTHSCYLTTGDLESQPAAPEHLRRNHYFQRQIGQANPRNFAIWRDAVTLTVGLRRVRGTVLSTADARQRASVLEAAAPLATAPTPEKTMDVLESWCAQQNVPYLWDALRSKLHSRPIIDAADALAARAWYRRRSA